MIRPAVLTLSLALLAGCGGNRTSLPPSAPVTAIASAMAAPDAVRTAELSILGLVPGKTTLEEFTTRFKVTEVKETNAKGVQTAEASLGAVLVDLRSVRGVFVDGVLSAVTVRAVLSETLEKSLLAALGKPSEQTDGMIEWKSQDRQVLWTRLDGEVEILDSNVPLGLKSFDRGYRGASE